MQIMVIRATMRSNSSIIKCMQSYFVRSDRAISARHTLEPLFSNEKKGVASLLSW